MLHINKSMGDEEVFSRVCDHIEPSQESIDETVAAEPPVPNGICISCVAVPCDIILVPCYDIVVCSSCWASKVEKHTQNCEVLYKNNKRKLDREKQKILCPCCSNVVKEAKTFRMATIQKYELLTNLLDFSN